MNCHAYTYSNFSTKRIAPQGPDTDLNSKKKAKILLNFSWILFRGRCAPLLQRKCCVWLRRCPAGAVDFSGGVWYDGASKKTEGGRPMTFGEKLTRLRKREGLSQESLAENLGVSRQAVSRWEQGTALPDAAKLLPCARLFRVSVEWLLDETRDWEDLSRAAEAPRGAEAPPVHRDRPWYIAGGIVTGVGVLGLVVMGILSAVYPAVASEAPAGVEWVHVYTGLAGFLKVHGVEWLFALWAAVALAGLWLLAQPSIRRRERGSSRFSLWCAAGTAAALYGAGQAVWYVQLGKTEDLLLLAIFLAASVWCTVRQLRRLGGEPDEARRRRERIITLLYTAAQGVILLLTAEAGFGLAALVFHVGVYFLCVGVLTGRPGRRKN